MKKSLIRSVLGVSAGVTTSALIGAGFASAAVVGPGSAVSIDYDVDNDLRQSCTVGAVGSNADGTQMAVISGHCGQVGDKVYLDTVDGPVLIGEVSHTSLEGDREPVASEIEADYAFITLYEQDGAGEDVQLTNNSSTTTVLSSLVDHPNSVPVVTYAPDGQPVYSELQLVWKDGNTLGRVPGVVASNEGHQTGLFIPMAPGDSGGPVYTTDGELIGFTSRGNGITGHVHNAHDAAEQYNEDTGNGFSYRTPGEDDPQHGQYRHSGSNTVNQVAEDLGVTEELNVLRQAELPAVGSGVIPASVDQVESVKGAAAQVVDSATDDVVISSTINAHVSGAVDYVTDTSAEVETPVVGKVPYLVKW